MHLPPNYMNYGVPVQYVQQPVSYVVRGAPVQQIYAPYPQQQVVQPKQARSKSWIPLALLRLLLVLTLIGAVTAAAKIRNNDLDIKENKVDKSVWITTLVFSCVGLVTSLLILLAYLSQCVFLPGCRLVPWTILFGLFDLAWFAAMIVLGSFCARRENLHQKSGLFRTQGINKGAFGITSAFALLAGVLFFISALLHFLFGSKQMKEQRRLAQVQPRF